MRQPFVRIGYDLDHKPEFLKIARALGCSKNELVGALYQVWRWIQTQTDGGASETAALEDIDLVADLPGLGQAMEAAGWVRDTPEALVFPRSDVWNGGRDHTNAERCRRYRERQATPPIGGATRASTRVAARVGASVGALRRADTDTDTDSNTEKKNPPNPPPASGPVRPPDDPPATPPQALLFAPPDDPPPTRAPGRPRKPRDLDGEAEQVLDVWRSWWNAQALTPGVRDADGLDLRSAFAAAWNCPDRRQYLVGDLAASVREAILRDAAFYNAAGWFTLPALFRRTRDGNWFAKVIDRVWTATPWQSRGTIQIAEHRGAGF